MYSNEAEEPALSLPINGCSASVDPKRSNARLKHNGPERSGVEIQGYQLESRLIVTASSIRTFDPDNRCPLPKLCLKN